MAKTKAIVDRPQLHPLSFYVREANLARLHRRALEQMIVFRRQDLSPVHPR